MPNDITTIKLSRRTKERLEKLRVYSRESYDEMMERVLDVLNLCRTNPEKARARLIGLERQTRRVGNKRMRDTFAEE